MSCGIDLGSRSVKYARLQGDQVAELKQWDSPAFYRQFGKSVDGKLTLDPADLIGLEELAATGYGRVTVAGAMVMTELRAHVLGALFQTGEKDFTLLDLGGQDSKVILVRGGLMADFMTNDKCAASSGRYIENMAGVLGITLEEISKHWQEPADLTSTCAVFGESEVIGKTVEGCSIERLAAGVNYALFKRIEPMLLRFRSEVLVFVGGVARNEAFHHILKTHTDFRVLIPPYPAHNAAIGCAISVNRVLA